MDNQAMHLATNGKVAGAPSQDRVKFTTTKTTTFQRFLQRIHNVDVTISRLVFQLSLPLSLEFLLSLPGNLFGPPFLQVVGPLWLLTVHHFHHRHHHDHDTKIWITIAATVTTIVLLLLPWVLFLRGRAWILGIFFSHVSFGLSPLIGMGISQYHHLYHGGGDISITNQSTRVVAASLCFHFIWLYNVSCILVLFLKHTTQRKRPCCTCPEYIPRKNFSLIPRVLAKTAPDTSFPSGDVMAATCFSLSLASLPLSQQAVPYDATDSHNNNPQQVILISLCIILVSLTALGRMYFLAHHLCDTLVGMLIPASLHLLCVYQSSSTTSSSYTAWIPALGRSQYYHSLGAFVGLVVASRFRRGDQK